MIPLSWVSSDFQLTLRSIKHDGEAPTLVVYSNCSRSDSLSIERWGLCQFIRSYKLRTGLDFDPFSFLRLLIFETRHQRLKMAFSLHDHFTNLPNPEEEEAYIPII